MPLLTLRFKCRTAYPLTQDILIQWRPDFSLPIHPFVWSIFRSIILGIAIGLFALLFLMLIRKILKP
ncbi:hypothetical protein [Coleofasciculus sp.]|uniref:hypothetical protein n=1 Tax=Coleofasciculus sp. TaxID=3100458 RepID=UPI003A1D4205